MDHPRSAHIGAIGEGWALQTLATAGVGTARPSVDLDGIDLVAWFIEGEEFHSAPLQLKTSSDGNVSIWRTKYADYIGMLYVLLDAELAVDAAYLIPQTEVRAIGEREYGHTTSWTTGSSYYRGPFSNVADDFAGFELTVASAPHLLRYVIDPPTCAGSVRP